MSLITVLTLLGRYLRWTSVLSRRVSTTALYVACAKETRFYHWPLLAFMATQALTLAMCPLARACLFEAVGPVRATTIYFPLAQGASGFFFFLVLRMPPLFLLGIGKIRKATLIRTYFSLYIGLMYKSVQLHAWNHKFPPRKHLGHYMFLGGQWVFWGASGFSDSLAPRASGCHSPMSRPATY